MIINVANKQYKLSIDQHPLLYELYAVSNCFPKNNQEYYTTYARNWVINMIN